MIGFNLMLFSMFAGLGAWLFGIRPYLMRRGVTVITAATWGVSAWSDWQQCSDFARKTGDTKASALSMVFALAQLGAVAGFIGMLCGI